jgi:nicotinate-nucleotide--dimethylbenzimidazole phosphoribosyltransferase
MIVSELGTRLREQIDNRTKPPGSLGRLEEIAFRIGMIQHRTDPSLDHPHIVVFAGDHGIAATGLVNAYPQSVTAEMVRNFLEGGAAINVFCRQNGIGLLVVDAGVNADLPGKDPRFIPAKIGRGTANYLEGPAMSPEELASSLVAGKRILDQVADRGCNCIGFGEMGIGNSSSAALILSAIAGIPVGDCVGQGTGMNDQQLEVKTRTLRQAFQQRFPQGADPENPLCILQEVGGFELAMMTGAYLQAAERGLIIVVDGFIATASLLVAAALRKEVLTHCIFAHQSAERAHRNMLSFLGAEPLLSLGLRLGEGTGSALAMPLIQAAVNFMNEMASFESAAVSRKAEID